MMIITFPAAHSLQNVKCFKLFLLSGMCFLAFFLVKFYPLWVFQLRCYLLGKTSLTLHSPNLGQMPIQPACIILSMFWSVSFHGPDCELLHVLSNHSPPHCSPVQNHMYFSKWTNIRRFKYKKFFSHRIPCYPPPLPTAHHHRY